MKIKIPTSQHNEMKIRSINEKIKCETISSMNVENTK